MATLSNCFCGPGRPATGGIRQREKVQAKELRDRMEAQIAPAARELEGLLVHKKNNGTTESGPCPSKLTGRAAWFFSGCGRTDHPKEWIKSCTSVKNLDK